MVPSRGFLYTSPLNHNNKTYKKRRRMLKPIIFKHQKNIGTFSIANVYPILQQGNLHQVLPSTLGFPHSIGTWRPVKVRSTCISWRVVWGDFQRGFRGFCTMKYGLFNKDSWNFHGLWQNNPHMDVSENSGTPKSSILIGFSIINHPFWGTTISGNT